ncbi:MAG: hypothetical protein J6J01_09340 [Oscillospiraceae bacterium]|nr:hypothetical protein [Oscillospiraceae bacterium]
MKTYFITLTYLYNYFDCEVEARSETEAVKIFWEEVASNEGQYFANRAKEHGKITCEIVVPDEN